MPKRNDLDDRLKGKEAMTMYANIIKRARSSANIQLQERSTDEPVITEDLMTGMSIGDHPSQDDPSSTDNMEQSSHYEESHDHYGEYFGYEEDANWDEQVCDNSEPTLYSAYTALLWFILESGINKSSVEKLLTIIQMFLPLKNMLNITKHKFFRMFESQIKMKKYYVCRRCNLILKQAECEHGKLDEFILWRNPIQTFKERLNRDNRFHDLCQYYRLNRSTIIENRELGKISSVWDGQQYIEIADPITQFYGGYSFLFNEDGATKWKSSACSACPIYLQNLEMCLEERIKCENIIFAGVWYGHKKLDCNLLFHLLVKNFIKAEHGVMALDLNNEAYVLKARIINSCLDNPSLASIFKMKQAGGESSCYWCNHQCCTIESRRCYPYLKQVGDTILDHAPRKEEHVQKAHSLLRSKSVKSVNGIKDVTVLMDLPYFIWTRSYSIELLHLTEGLFKVFIKLWAVPKYNNGKVRISADNWKHFEDVLCVQRIPEVFGRQIRSITDHFKYYKASEALVFLLYSSKLLIHFDWFEKYKNNHLLFIECFTQALTKGNTKEQLIQIKKKFISWLVDFQRVYGPKVSYTFIR